MIPENFYDLCKQKWESLTLEQKRRFPPICPDFLIELRSSSERLKSLQDRMQEYLDSGLSLGWLINPQEQTVEIVNLPVTLSVEDVLFGFSLLVE